jgi:CheY-like chemotaxis protein
MADATGTAPLPKLDGICVLIIDDDDDGRAVLAAHLHWAGATVTSAAAGDDALDDLTQFLPDVIVCDLRMPRVDGLTFVRTLRARPAADGGQIPVIAVTAYHEEYTPDEARQAGFAAYLPKPLRYPDVCRAILASTRPPR